MRCRIGARLTLLCLLATLIGWGCAFGNRHVELSYPPERKDTGPAEAVAGPAPEPFGDAFLNVTPFNDIRENMVEVGCVRNGFGMKTAKVIADNDVADWITEAVIMELKNAGYSVVKVTSAEEAESGPVLTGDVVKVYCDAFFSYAGEVMMSARIMDGEKEVLRKTYTGKGSAGANWAAGSKAFGQSLSLALGNAITYLVADIDSALEK